MKVKGEIQFTIQRFIIRIAFSHIKCKNQNMIPTLLKVETFLLLMGETNENLAPKLQPFAIFQLM